MTRAQRRVLHVQLSRKIRGIELEYEQRVRKAIKPFLDSRIAQAKPVTRKDAVDDEDDATDEELDDIDDAIAEAYDRMARRVNVANQENLRLQGIAVDPTKDKKTAETIARAREENIALIRGWNEDFIKDCQDIIGDPDNLGVSVKDLRDMLLERGNVTKSRATLVARDQTNRLNREINKSRQEDAGIERAQWSCSMDERVRPTHRALEGKIFSWDSPPEEYEDIQCRCVQIAILDIENDSYDNAGEEDEDTDEEDDDGSDVA